MTELDNKLKEVMKDKGQEISMASVIGINCKVPEELHNFLMEFLKLTTEEEEILGKLYELTPDQITILTTLAMIANGRVSDFIRLERNMIVLKLSTVNWITDNPEYRETSVDENEDNPEAMLDALIKMREIMRNSSINKRRD